MPLIEIVNATVVKNGRTLLDAVSLTVEAGQHTAILGPNGCGKSTLIKLLTFQDYPVWNAAAVPPVRVLGEANWDVFELRKKLGIVSADLSFRFLHDYGSAALTAREAVLTGFFAARELFAFHEITVAMELAADEALARMDAAELAEKPLEWLSTGELRRVLLARALVHQPLALILDEPTSGLDLVAAARFLESLRGLAQGGVTLILVTHHLEELIPELAQVALMQKGKVAAVGEPALVCTRERLSAAFETTLTSIPATRFCS